MSLSTSDTRAQGPIVLLVDGDADSVDMYAFMLSRAGFDVDTATNGAQAMIQLGRRAPALIALELSLSGGISGYELCRRVRGRADVGRIPLIAVTAHAFPWDALQAIAAGCDVVLTKPCLPGTLVDEVRRQISLARCAPEAEVERYAGRMAGSCQ